MKKLFKGLKIFLIIVLTITGVIALLNVIPIAPSVKKENPWLVKDGEPLNIPHGGAKLLHPENTKFSFDETAKYGIFEIDLSMTKDGVLISHHDTNMARSLTPVGDSLEKTADRVILSMTFDQVKQKIVDADYPFAKSFVNAETGVIDFSSKPATDFLPIDLEDMFILYPNHKYILEIKDTIKECNNPFYKEAADSIFETHNIEAYKMATDKLLELIAEHDMEDNVIVGSFDDDVIKYLKTKNDTILTSSAWNETLKFVVMSALFVDFFYFPKCEIAILPIDERISSGGSYDLLKKIPGFIRNRIATKDGNDFVVDLGTKRAIEDLHRHDVAVFLWTVNESAKMEELIELKADGIITDRPDLLASLLN